MASVKNTTIAAIVITLVIGYLTKFYFFAERATHTKTALSAIKESKEPKEKSEIPNNLARVTNAGSEVIIFDSDSIEMQYRNASDFYALALELLEQSKAGNAESQFYLVKILLSCQGALPLKNRLIDDEETNFERELTEKLVSKCAYFNKENIKTFNEVEHWIALSAKSEYGPSIILNLLFSSHFEETVETLQVLRKALSSKHPDVMLMMSTLSKSETTKKAWSLIACHYGSDCSKESSNDWRYRMAAQCSLNIKKSDSCLNGSDYRTFVREFSTPSEYQKILIAERTIREFLEERNYENLTFEELLN